MHAARQKVLRLGPGLFIFHNDLSLAPADPSIVNRAIDLRDDGRLFGLARLKKFDDTRQTTRDVLGLGGLSGNLGKSVSGKHRISGINHDVGFGRNQVRLNDFTLRVFDLDLGLALLVRRLDNHLPSQTGNLVQLLLHGEAFHDVLGDRGSPNFGEDGEGIRIPFHEFLSRFDLLALLDHQLGPIDHRVSLLLPAFIIQDNETPCSVHDHLVAFLIGDRLNIQVMDNTLIPRFNGGFFLDPAGSTPNVKCSHGELSAGLSDGLGG